LNKIAFMSLLLLVFVIPFENMLIVPGFGTISRVVGAFSFLFCFLSIIIDKKQFTITNFQKKVLVFIYFSVCSYFWSVEQGESLKAIISLIQIFIFILLMIEFFDSPQKKINSIQAYIAGAYVSSIATIFMFFTKTESFYLRYSAKGFDPNDLGVILAVGVPMAWYLFLTLESKLLKTIFSLYIPICGFAVVLTSSRTAFVVYLIGLVLIPWTVFSLTKLTRSMTCFFILVVLTIFIYVVPPSSIGRLLTVVDESMFGSLNSRTLIWENYIELFSEKSLIGYGVGSSQNVFFDVNGIELATHNLFISHLVNGGFVGLTLFLVIIFEVIRKTFKLNDNEFKFWILVLFCWFLGVMNLNWEMRKPTWFIFTMIILFSIESVRMKKQEKYVE